MSADPETGEIIHRADEITPPGYRLDHEPMDLAQAKQVTSQINAYGVSLCHLIVSAHDGQAWRALGCDSWESYCDEQLNVSRQRAHQLIQHARKLTILSGLAGVPVDMLDVPERHTRGMDLDAAVAVVGEAIRALPEDAPITTRGDLIKAITAQMQAEAQAAKSLTASTAVDAPAQDRCEGEPAPASGDTLAAPDPASENAEANAAGDAGGQPEANDMASGAAGPVPPSGPAAKDEPGALDAAMKSAEAANPKPFRRLELSKARDQVRNLIAFEPETVAAVIDPDDWDSYLSLCDDLTVWAADTRAALTPNLRSVK